MTASERRLTGVPGANGVAIGPAYVLRDVEIPVGGDGGPDEQAKALAALRATAKRLGEAVHYLQGIGRGDEAAILEASQLMADDPTLLEEVEALAATRTAAAALLGATERQAALLASIPDPHLAARASDVRRLGRQAARLVLDGESATPRGAMHGGAMHCAPTEQSLVGMQFIAPLGVGLPRPVVLVARDLGPADLAEIELEGIELGGIALAEGSVTSHAAIVARSWGVPLVVGLGEAALSVADGERLVVDGTAGLLAIAPSDETVQQAEMDIARERTRRDQLAHSRRSGCVTRDGHGVRLLVNASTEREVLAGLAAGAEGVGLLRTELAFLDATAWPDEHAHEAALTPVLRHLGGRIATVRTLDFGADKLPPFLHGQAARGIALQLSSVGALAAQVRALLRAGAETRLRIMLPLVEEAGQIVAARRALEIAHQDVGLETSLPPLGAMIETARAVERADEIAAVADFLSIGTNDLVQSVLGLDRLTPAATVRAAADPRLLRAIRVVTDAARRHGRRVEVCGEAAGDPRIAVLLIGLGVTELSVTPARLDEIRVGVQSVSLAQAAELAHEALVLGDGDAVLSHADAALTQLDAATDDPGD